MLVRELATISLLLCSVAGVRMVASMVPAWDRAAASLGLSTIPCNTMQAILARLADVCASKTIALLPDGP